MRHQQQPSRYVGLQPVLDCQGAAQVLPASWQVPGPADANSPVAERCAGTLHLFAGVSSLLSAAGPVPVEPQTAAKFSLGKLPAAAPKCPVSGTAHQVGDLRPAAVGLGAAGLHAAAPGRAG
jgi:hypothetical protein